MFAAVHQGASVIDILNHLGVDYFTLGNHEFDFGSDQVRVLMDQVRGRQYFSRTVVSPTDFKVSFTSLSYLISHISHETTCYDTSFSTTLSRSSCIALQLIPLNTYQSKAISHTNPTQVTHILTFSHTNPEQFPVAGLQRT